MNTSHIFGGALVNSSVISATTGTPSNPRIAPQLQRFLSMMEKAYLLAADETFGRCLEAFAEEMDVYLDDRRLGQADPKGVPSLTWQEQEGLERALDRAHKHRKAKK